MTLFTQPKIQQVASSFPPKMEELNRVQGEIARIVSGDEQLKNVNINDIVVPDDYVSSWSLSAEATEKGDESEMKNLPTMPAYFKISKLTGVSKANKKIHLEIEPENVPTCVCGDNCATNVKGKNMHSFEYNGYHKTASSWTHVNHNVALSVEISLNFQVVHLYLHSTV